MTCNRCSIDSCFGTHAEIPALEQLHGTWGLRHGSEHDQSDRLPGDGADAGQLGGEVETIDRQPAVQQHYIDVTTGEQPARSRR